MERNLHIYYRHVHSKAEQRSRDPNKSRPEWFSYEACFRNLLATIQHDPFAHRVRLTVMFDGTQEDYADDFVSKYSNNLGLGLGLAFLQAGSDMNSAILTAHHVYHSQIPDGDVVYMLENDYLHQPNWVSKVFDLYDSELFFDYVSLYDHGDKYFLPMYDDLSSRVLHSGTHHWRTAPSTCGSYLSEITQFRLDYDVFQSGIQDFYLFQTLVEQRQRVLLTPIPGLSTHCMEHVLSPVVDWKSYLV